MAKSTLNVSLDTEDRQALEYVKSTDPRLESLADVVRWLIHEHMVVAVGLDWERVVPHLIKQREVAAA